MLLQALSDQLYNRCYYALYVCVELEHDESLWEIFKQDEQSTYHELTIYLPWIQKYRYNTKKERVEGTIRYLVRQRLGGKRPVLPLFLAALSNNLPEGDVLLDELVKLGEAAELALSIRPGAAP